MKKFRRDYNLSPVEFIKFQLDQSINYSTKKLSDTELIILTYIYLYGMDCHQKLLKDRIFTNPNSIVNYLSRLTKEGYVIKEISQDKKESSKRSYDKIYLNPQLKIVEEDFIQISIISLNKDSEEVYHPNFRR